MISVGLETLFELRRTLTWMSFVWHDQVVKLTCTQLSDDLLRELVDSVRGSV
jgi:hypothetical protein